MSDQQLKRKIAKLEEEAARLKSELDRLKSAESESASDCQGSRENRISTTDTEILQSIIEDLNGSLWAIDREYRIVVANSDFRELYCKSLRPKLGIGDSVFTDDLSEEISNNWKGWYDRALNGEKLAIESRRRYSDPPVWGEYRFSPVYNANGKIIGCSVLFNDITDRKKFEDNLRKSHIDLNLAQSIANIGNWHYDPDEDSINWSDEMYRITERDQAMGPLPFVELSGFFDQTSLQGLIQKTEKAIQDAIPYDIELELKVPSGLKWVHVMCEPETECGSQGHRIRGTIQDMTAFRLNSRALEEKNQFISTLLNNLAVGVVSCDGDGILTFFNPVAEGFHEQECRSIGPEDWLKHYNFCSIETGRRLELSQVPLYRALKGEHIQNFEMLIVSRKGKVTVVSSNSQPVYGADGQLQGAMVTMNDITERKRVEDTLKRSEEHQKQLLNGLPDIVYIYSIKNGALHWSGNVTGILGFVHDDMIDNPYIWTENILEKDRGEVKAVLEDIDQQSGFDIEYRIRDKKGLIHWFRDRSFRIEKGPDDTIIYGIASDITENKQIFLELKRSNFLLSAAEKIANLGSWEYDLVNDICTFSDSMCLLHGVSNEPMTIDTLLKLFHPDDKERMRQALADSKQGKDYTLEHRILRQDTGEIRFMSAYGRIILSDDRKPRLLRGASIDITERKEAENRREELIGELQEALAHVKTLKGLIPICASCKKIRDDGGYWHQVEAYIRDHSDATFSHGICPECMKKLYPELDKDDSTDDD